MKKGSLKGRKEKRSPRFAEALANLLRRKQRPFNRPRLARELGVDESLLSLLVANKRHPTPAFIGRVCSHPSVTSDEALELITAHLQDVAAEAFPEAGKMTVGKIRLALDDQRMKAAV